MGLAPILRILNYLVEAGLRFSRHINGPDSRYWAGSIHNVLCAGHLRESARRGRALWGELRNGRPYGLSLITITYGLLS